MKREILKVLNRNGLKVYSYEHFRQGISIHTYDVVFIDSKNNRYNWFGRTTVGNNETKEHLIEDLLEYISNNVK